MRSARRPTRPSSACPRTARSRETFIGNATTLDRDQVEREVVAAARDLLARHPAVDTIVFECTNLPPYKKAVENAAGLPVFDVLDLLKGFYAGLTGAAGGGRQAAAG